jgi:REP element-mobilizing transposase RayT
MAQHREFYRRHLPHWQPAGATLFVTFRLSGSLPRTVIAQLQAERDRREAKLLQIQDPEERSKQAYLEARLAFGKWDRALDTVRNSPRWLSQPPVAEIIVEALHHRDKHVYDLLVFCVMPNHVHLVCTPLTQKNESYYVLHEILQSLKGYTARRANPLLGRKGTFWQEENYDHVVRDQKELNRILRYVIYNPVKAGLVQDWEAWPWTYISPEVSPEGV